MLENITVIFQAENIIMRVNILELTGFLTASEQECMFCCAHRLVQSATTAILEYSGSLACLLP